MRIYASYDAGQRRLQNFRPTDFGYREIRVERPLRLAFQVTEDRLQALAEDRAIEKLGEPQIVALLNALRDDLGDQRFTNRPVFESALTKTLKHHGITASAPVRKAIASALSERDENAESAATPEAAPNPIPTCATPSSSHSPRIGATTSPAKSSSLSPMPGSMSPIVTGRMAKPGVSDTRSTSIAIFTNTCHPAQSKRLTPNLGSSKPKSRNC